MLSFNFTPFPALTTAHLSLRALAIEDAPEIYRLRSDKKVMEFIARPHPKSVEDAQNLIEKLCLSIVWNEQLTWAMSLKNSTKLIGQIGYWAIDAANHRAEIGYLLDPDYQGQGLMQEAMEAVINYGFGVMRLHSIEAHVHPLNAASIGLLLKNNFVKEAYFKENYYHQGKFLDTVIFSLLQS